MGRVDEKIHDRHIVTEPPAPDRSVPTQAKPNSRPDRKRTSHRRAEIVAHFRSFAIIYPLESRLSFIRMPYWSSGTVGRSPANPRRSCPRRGEGIHFLVALTSPQQVDANGDATQFTFDGDNRVKTETDGAGDLTTSVYDQAGDLTQNISPLGQITTYLYDNDSRVTTIVDPLGYITTEAYDADSREVGGKKAGQVRY
jgi:YD repeat-containing protein